ncbi:succinate dehydrogenase assembly factor 3, mitochondrial-like [Daphnia pulicaria]|uniref:succinate dehydrogenase assembly factor 3, mitochondrial-like n=1 Tax=Daphnia pulicaria TaxID=35523 RepID=UPI001EEC945B|nr:succinate dehydrogenase assembly factor 3, mitochondrial-like [Daphnia pulicaria]
MASAASTAFTHVQRVRLLYKTILRIHRGLPLEIKAIGDQYVKDEFKRHKTCQPQEVNQFMTGWVDYAVTLAKQLNVSQLKKQTPALGKHLTPEELDLFKDDQISQLHELMQEAIKPKVDSVEDDILPKKL